MIIGLLLAIAVSVSVASLGIILMGMSGALRENLATGAVIGAGGVISYATITLTVSLIAIFFLALILKNNAQKDIIKSLQ
ncbi:MAG: hypothetical protein KKF50_01445 [Nanoarchaeota archaeon]|nr:hypothetical protein [Nanoarchaeota archaeon]